MRICSGHIYCDVDFFKGFHLNRYFVISSFATLTMFHISGTYVRQARTCLLKNTNTLLGPFQETLSNELLTWPTTLYEGGRRPGRLR